MTKTIYPATLLCDFYKLAHREQYPKNTQVIYSTFTPRSNVYFPQADKVVVFGVQAFIKKYLIEYFNTHFFNRKKEEVVAEYARFIRFSCGEKNPHTLHIEMLHDLGYLPLSIRALKEGTRVKPKVPVFTMENTDYRFFWLTNYLETIMSSEIWQPMTSATTSYQYRALMDEYALMTTGSTAGVEFQGHDFSARGMVGLEGGAASGAAHLLSFVGTDSAYAIYHHEEYYNANMEDELIGTSIPACYDNKTEILSEKGWKLFSDLTSDEKVAQYNEDGSIDFVVPTEHYNMKYKGKMVGFKSKDGHKYVDLLVTPNHRMVKRRLKDNSLQIFEADSQKYHEKKGYGSKSKIVVSGKAASGRVMSALEKLKVAFQADGSHMSRDAYTGKRNGTVPVRFSLKKDRKKDRLVELTKEAGLDYSLNKYEDGYYSFYIKTNGDFIKDLSWVDLSDVSYEWACEFIQELIHWDASKKSENTITYTSIKKSNVDVVQALSSLAGHKCLISEYTDERNDYERSTIYIANIWTNKETIGGRNIEKYFVDYDSTVHCVSVPSKMLVVRRNDVVAVSGNTEHSVMSASTGADGDRDEYEMYKRLLTEVYPRGFFSVVSDTYDFWKVVGGVLPRLKKEIMVRDGRAVIRPDSGDPVKIICGKKIDEYKTLEEAEDSIAHQAKAEASESCEGSHRMGADDYTIPYKLDGRYYKMTIRITYNRHDKTYYYVDGYKVSSIVEFNPRLEDLGLIEALWNEFGGTVTEQGYKVLDTHIGAIYGDSITLDRAKRIFEGLKAKGFASTNVVLGIGSFTFQFVTRDTLGFAMKATYALVDGEERMLFKDPKTDDGTKRSQRGRVAVVETDGEFILVDGLDRLTYEAEYAEIDQLEEIFLDGKLLRDESLKDIRARLHSTKN